MWLSVPNMIDSVPHLDDLFALLTFFHLWTLKINLKHSFGCIHLRIWGYVMRSLWKLIGWLKLNLAYRDPISTPLLFACGFIA